MRLVGRESELRLLRRVLGETQKGNTNVVLISGEPGIGKTAILRVFSESIDKQTFCDIRSSYFPESRETLSSLIVAKCQRLHSEILHDCSTPANDVVDSPLAFANSPVRANKSSISDFVQIREILKSAARSRPFVIILDDFHHIDAASLDLFSHLALTLNDVPVCVIAAYRSSEIEKVPRSALEIIKRRALNLEMRPLSTSAIQELLTEMIPIDRDGGLLKELRDLAGGNPKLILEYQQVIAADGTLISPDAICSIPLGISIAINERLQELSLLDRHLLACASVIGSSFEHELAINIAEIDRSAALKTLSQFEMRGFIRPSSSGQFEFNPGLLREVLYHELPPDVRATLHHRIGMILKRLSANSTEDFEERIARHLLKSREPGAVEEALEHAGLAGRRFLRVGNYAKASEMFALTLDAARRCSSGSEAQLCDQLTEYGEALKEMGDLAAAEEVFREAVSCAERLGEVQRICELALKVPDYHWPLPGSSSALAILLCERALKLVDSPGLKARLASRLAAELSYDPSQTQRSLALIALSMETADKGEDAALMLHVLRFRDCTLRHPDHLEERVTNAAEMSRLAREIGDHVSLWEASTARIASLLALGRLNESEREFQILEQTTKMIRRPLYRAVHFFSLANRAAFFGRLNDCERMFDLGRHEAIVGKIPGILARCWPALIIPYAENDRLLGLDSLANEDLAIRHSDSPVEQALRCWLNARLGRRFEARMQLHRLAVNDFTDLRSSADFLAGAVALAAACLRIDNVSHYAARLYDLLLPYADRDAVLGQVAYLGSVSFCLGRLANVFSNRDDAIRHFRAASERHSQMEARPWSLYSAYELAGMLLKDEDRERRRYASALLSQIKTEAESRGMRYLAKRVTGLSASDSHPTRGVFDDESIMAERSFIHVNPESDATREITGVFRKVDRFWTLTYRGQTVRAKDRKGLTLISLLMSKPQESIHVSVLAGEISGAHNSTEDIIEGFEATDLGAMIDPEAKRSYQVRARELRQELNEAKLHNDLGRVESLEQELRFLMRELARAVGLYGRDRASVSSNQRARLRVTNVIRSAISVVSVHHAPLATHLNASIRTGLFCAYRPNIDSRVEWEL
jgi:tetratricopeptide (TPR) repeat protein